MVPGTYPPNSTANCTCELPALPLRVRFGKPGVLRGLAAGVKRTSLCGQERTLSAFGYKSNYPIIVLCELASPH